MSHEKQHPSSQREGNGQFAKGNSGGPGNPHARQVAQLRKVMLQCVTDKDMEEITLTLIDLAKQGNVQACRLLFSYLLGKPTPGVDPDQLDVEEWELGRKSAKMFSEVKDVMESPEPGLTLKLTRVARESATEKAKRAIGDLLEQMDAEDRKKEQRREKRRHRTPDTVKASDVPPSPNGNCDSSPPSPNGDSVTKIPLDELQHLEESST